MPDISHQTLTHTHTVLSSNFSTICFDFWSVVWFCFGIQIVKGSCWNTENFTIKKYQVHLFDLEMTLKVHIKTSARSNTVNKSLNI